MNQNPKVAFPKVRNTHSFSLGVPDERKLCEPASEESLPKGEKCIFL